jgi:hypothetical protein
LGHTKQLVKLALKILAINKKVGLEHLGCSFFYAVFSLGLRCQQDVLFRLDSTPSRLPPLYDNV